MAEVQGSEEKVVDSTIIEESGPVESIPALIESSQEPVDKISEHEVKIDSSGVRSQLDEVLVEALRVPRDRIFVLRQEKEMEDRIRGGQEQWELPLMNSYQRLLVHRIADHFHLAHSIDAVTKAVTLTRQGDTGIPELSLSTLAMVDMERLSEPAYAISRDNSATGFKIMRREGTGKSGSSRNGSITSPEGRGLARDRRNMTIEEREAAYKEARQRIFGSEEGSGETAAEISPSGEVEVKGFANLSLEGESSSSSNKSDSRRGTPGRLSPAHSSTSSTSSAAFLRAGAPSFDPNMRGAPMEVQWQQPMYGYPIVDSNGNHYFPYPPGYAWPPYLQQDINGRQIVPQGAAPLISPSYPFSTPGSSGSNQDVYSSFNQSPSVSSRSTSISAETEGEGSQSSALRPVVSDQSLPAVTGGSRGRPHSISPSASFQRNGSISNYQPSVSSNGSSSGGGVGTAPLPSHVYQGQVPVPASWNHYQPGAMAFHPGSRPYPSTPTYNVEDASGRSQRVGPTLTFAGTSRPGTLASSSSSSHSSSNGAALVSPVASSSSRTEDIYQSNQTRSRNGQSDRSLFDPNKPTNNGSSSNSNNSNNGQLQIGVVHPEDGTSRHLVGKSASAAGLLESRPSSDQSRMIPGNLAHLNPDLSRRISSSSISPSDSIRRVTPPSHPSLPARPDWAMPQKSRPPIEQSADQSADIQAKEADISSSTT